MNSESPTTAEQGMVLAAQGERERCVCGDVHDDDSVTPAVIARMQGYLASNPGHEFAVDDEAGIVALILPREVGTPGRPEVLAWANDLVELLDHIGAPAAADLS